MSKNPTGVNNVPLKPVNPGKTVRIRSASDPRESVIPLDVLEWIEAGNPVFAVHSTDEKGKCTCGNTNCEYPGKHPVKKYSPNGKTNPTKDLATVASWFKSMPNVSIGMRLDNLLVIDIDRHEGKDDGFKPFDRWSSLSGWMDDTRIHGTPRNGKHLFYKKPTGKFARGTSILGPGLDVLASAADSAIIHGTRNGKQYTIESQWNQADLPKFPDSDQLRILRSIEKTGLSDAFKTPITAGNRHSRLVQIGGTLRNAYKKDTEIEFFIRALNAIVVDPPYSERELENQIKGILKLKAEKQITGKSVDDLPDIDNRILFDTYATDYEIEKAVCENLNLFNNKYIADHGMPFFYLYEKGKVLNIKSDKAERYEKTDTSGKNSIPALEALYKSKWHAYKGTEDQGYKPYRYAETNHKTIRTKCIAYAPMIDDVYPHPVMTGEKGRYKLLADRGIHRDQKIIIDCQKVSLIAYKPELEGSEALEQFVQAKDRARDAFNSIMDLVSENEFQTEAHKIRWFMAFMTPLLMPVIKKAPLAVIEASTQGSGKSTLAEIIKYTYNNRVTPDINFGGDSVFDENRREDQLTSLYAYNDFTVALIDNVTATVTSDVITKLLTSGHHDGRPKYNPEMMSFKNRALWMLTANNTKCHPDFFRRSVIIRLEPKTARPELKEYKIADMPEHCRKNRINLITSAMEILNSWILADAPESDVVLGSFREWSQIILGIVQFLGIYSGNLRDLIPTDAEKEMLSDDRSDAFTSLVQLIYNRYESAPLTAKSWHEYFLYVDDSQREILADAFPSGWHMSKALNENRGKVFKIDAGLTVQLVDAGKDGTTRAKLFSLKLLTK